MAAAAENAAAERVARYQAIDPGNGIVEFPIALGGKREEFVEPAKWDGLDIHHRTRDRHHFDLDPGDDAGEAESPDCRGEQPCRIVGTELHCASVGTNEPEPPHPAPKRAGAVMVLAVDIVGDSAAQGHKARSWRHRQKEPARHQQPQQRIQ
jgi:hypothetical protein